MTYAAKFEQTQVNKVKQVAKRGHYDRETVYRILDANLVGNVGFASAEGPFIIPMLFARRDDELLFHGSTKSRLMQMLCSGDPVCVSVTTLDGLVLAKSLFHHSMNYRSVSAFGTGRELKIDSDRLEALRMISDKVMPGRWDDARQPSPQEMKATCVAAVRIDSASAKIRRGPPIDDVDDMQLPVWTGIIPLIQTAQPAVRAPDDEIVSEFPRYMKNWRSSFNDQMIEAIGDSKTPSTNGTRQTTTLDVNSPSILSLAEPYLPRRTTMLGVREINGWRLKLYSISLANQRCLEQVVEAAIQHAERNVQWPNRSQGYGFVTIHFGEQIWLLIDLWVDDILRHFVFRSTYENPTHFVDGPDDGTSACVWEFEITKHERDSWVKQVLSNPANPSFEQYLADRIEINIS